jgi:peptidoglycan/xylan/chitin deacetylase (PgdA/CDA1 family)
MPRHWTWDFEDEHDSRQAGTAPTTTEPSRERVRQVRRRRRGAALLLVSLGVLGLAILLAGPGSQHRPAPSASAAAAQVKARTPPARTAASPEDDQDAAVSSVLAYTPFVKEGGDRGRDIALTFDDGPGPYTPGVLSVLERLRVHATFFVIGKMLRYFSASTVREIKDGDVIGDHTETHPQMALLSAHEQYEELFEQIARIELLGGPRPVLFRPPYGSFNTTTLRELHRLHLLMTLWSVDTEDYLQPGVSVIVQRVLAGAHAGAIVLMHDAGGTRTQTIAALPIVIDDLRARGFHLVTVPQLLEDDPPPPGQPLPPNLSGD